jgi:hypothetical protein
MPLIVAALGAIGVAAYAFSKKDSGLVRAKSGKDWKVTLLSTAGNVKTWEVWAPAGSFGPHGELSVIRYSQTGSDINSRKVVGTGAGVPADMITTAKSDFGAV